MQAARMGWSYHDVGHIKLWQRLVSWLLRVKVLIKYHNRALVQTGPARWKMEGQLCMRICIIWIRLAHTTKV